MQSVLGNVCLSFPPAQTISRNGSKVVRNDERLCWNTYSAPSTKNGYNIVKRLRIIGVLTKKEKSKLLDDSEPGESMKMTRKDGFHATKFKHGVHQPSKRGLESQTLNREGKLENKSTSNMNPHRLQRQQINSHVPRKYTKDIESSRGGWGNFFPYPPESNAKLLNSSKGEDSKFDSGGNFFSLRTFKDIGASEDMLHALKTQAISQPSHIQAMAYKHVLDGQSCIIAEQSGSGKTLAYLAPLVQRLREEELKGISKSMSKSPRVLILVPTAELATQVLNACRAISKEGMPFRSMVVTGGYKWKTQLENLEQGTDILIATSGRFYFLLQEGELQLSNLLSIVLDEVDILFDDKDFSLVLETLMNSAPLVAQYLFVTATLPVDVHNKLLGKFPDCKAVFGPGLHRTCSGLEEILIDCSGEGEERNPETAFENKKTALTQILEQSPVQRTLVFCNKIETCRKVENVLKRLDRKGRKLCVLPFHAAVSQDSRVSNMQRFLDSQSEQSRFLICTDRASRGLDLINVDHVVLFDFPRDPSEYVRRVGRTARGAGGRGKAFAFAVGKQVSLAQRIMERNEKGHPLHDLPSVF